MTENISDFGLSTTNYFSVIINVFPLLKSFSVISAFFSVKRISVILSVIDTQHGKEFECYAFEV